MAKKKYSYDYPRPALTVDIVLFTVAGVPLPAGPRAQLLDRSE